MPCLVFYLREATFVRLVAALRRVAPSDTELQVLRRELTAVLADKPNATVGNFQQLPPEGGWHAAKLYIAFPAVQAQMPMPREVRYV